MKKSQLLKMGISLILIVVLAIFIVNIGEIISSEESIDEQDVAVNQGGLSEEEESVVVDYETLGENGECFANYGKSPSSVVFVHSNSCPHCIRMKPIVQELEEEGYGFYWAESSNSEAREIVSGCLSSLLSGYVPQFICPATGKEQTGAMTKEDLKEFADNCV